MGRNTRNDMVGDAGDNDRDKRAREYAQLKEELDRRWRERQSENPNESR